MRLPRLKAPTRIVSGRYGRLRNITAQAVEGPDIVSRRLRKASADRWGRLHLRHDLAAPDAHRRFPDEGPGWQSWGLIAIVMIALMALAGAPL